MGFTRINRVTKTKTHYTWHELDEVFYSDKTATETVYMIPANNYLYKFVID